MNDITKCYETLGLKPEASLDEVKEAYRDLVKVWHPDRFAQDPKLQLKAQEKLKEINEAYQKIQDFLENLSAYQQATGTNRKNTTETNTDTEQASAPDKEKRDSPSQPPPKPPSASPNNARTSHQEIRPWVRFWARTLDLALMSIPAALLLGLLLGVIAPKFLMRITEGGNLIFLPFMLPFTVLMEAIIIALFGNTPGKAILKTKITNAEGGKLSFTEALKRSLFIYFYGYAFGLPIINLITYALQHKRLKKTGKATWDSKLGFNVTHAHIGGVRIASAALLSLIIIAGFGIINVATKETTRTEDAKTQQEVPKVKLDVQDPFAKEVETHNGLNPAKWEDIDLAPIQGTGVPTQPIDTTKPVTSIEQADTPIESKPEIKTKSLQPAVPPKWFFNKLTILVPDWKTINNDPDFLEWLRQADANSQKTLHEKMLEAYSNNNVESVAFFFIRYKNESRATR